ncbi:MAG: UDP-N-acetylmuramoyl-L-alanyl-D-glutamate--2,6-diaminopimelate ligase [Pelagibacterales bacterium]|nr:UDP-N-acetylmuramoyl-L-alanyl-D-glutamate--2,6-diaminopimelate ligase [Pelagibacterales bacterium]
MLSKKIKFLKYQNRNFSINSKKVNKNDIFFAIEGSKQSGSLYSSEALSKGAYKVVTSKKIRNKNYLIVKNVKKFLAEACSVKYKEKPKNIIAVTGTNGKSSVANFYFQILKNLKINSAAIGTLGIFYKNKVKRINLTTPDIITIHKELNFLKKKKIDNVCLEASSHGLHQNRLDGINFTAGIFTNFTQDHLDYHKNLKNYLQAKLYLFSSLLKKNSFAILDTDIPEFSIISKICKKRKIKILSFGSKGNAIKLISHYYFGKKQIIKINFLNKIYNIKLDLIGDFQIKNLFAAILASYLSVKNPDQIINVLSKIRSATGRMQYVGNKKKSAVVVDYAHTPDALKKSLQTLAKQFNKKVDVVFGCGGDRDKGKRYKMGKIANQFASKIYLTNDNPRSENPTSIINQIKTGCLRGKIILDRKIAIKTAINNLNTESNLLITGKGHENYQIINNQKKYFSDQKVSKLFLK